MGCEGASEIMYEALGAIYLQRDVLDRVVGVLYRMEPEARDEKGIGRAHSWSQDARL